VPKVMGFGVEPVEIGHDAPVARVWHLGVRPPIP
jgi:hypothetical protein